MNRICYEWVESSYLMHMLTCALSVDGIKWFVQQTDEMAKRDKWMVGVERQHVDKRNAIIDSITHKT